MPRIETVDEVMHPKMKAFAVLLDSLADEMAIPDDGGDSFMWETPYCQEVRSALHKAAQLMKEPERLVHTVESFEAAYPDYVG